MQNGAFIKSFTRFVWQLLRLVNVVQILHVNLIFMYVCMYVRMNLLICEMDCVGIILTNASADSAMDYSQDQEKTHK